MSLSAEQFNLLKIFYEKNAILYSELAKYNTFERSPLIRSLQKEFFIRAVEYFPKDGYPSYTKAYEITYQGRAAYEEYLKILEQENYEKETLRLQKRQTEASENAVDEAKKARTEARIAYVIAGLSLIIAIVALFI